MRATLRAELESTGMFAAPSPAYHVRLVATLAATVALACWWWWPPLTIALLGLACVQLGFFGHDAVHGAVSSRRWVNVAVGYVSFSIANGVGFQYWTRIHLAHHRHLQVDGRDPDVDFPNALSVTEGSAAAKTGA